MEVTCHRNMLTAFSLVADESLIAHFNACCGVQPATLGIYKILVFGTTTENTSFNGFSLACGLGRHYKSFGVQRYVTQN